MAITVETRTQVSQLYTALFGRAPDFDGLGFWTNLIGSGESLVRVADAMYATAPARTYYPLFLANQEIVASFYLNVLGRVADAGGLAFWTARLSTPGTTPGKVIVEMISAVVDYTGTDPAGLTSKQLFLNKVTVAQHYGEKGGNAAGAFAALAGVTSDPATVTAAINRIDGVDVDRPVFSSAVVTASTLVLTYTDANALDAAHAPAASAFTVMVAGVARAVSSVAVDAAGKTVTLTLASAVTSGQVVTVAYADPTTGNDANAVQDASGNDAATLSATSVTNSTVGAPDTTAPVFASATVNGTTLVMTYTEANALNTANPPAASAFTVMVAGVARTVSSVAVDGTAKTVTLTLATAVIGGEAVTVAYADPTTGNDTNAIQDASGNDAATLSATNVTNNTAGGVDTTKPVFASASVNGAALEMLYTELNYLDPNNLPAVGDFTVMVAGVARAVTAVDIHAVDKTVTLTLASAVANGQVVTVGYTDPTSGNDANALQDLAGNDAVTITAKAVTNTTPDTTAPLFASATVTGTSLVMTYTEVNLLNATATPAASAFTVMVAGVARAVNSVAVSASGKTVTLTLASAVADGQVVTVAYADPTSGNDANAIQDATGNDAATLVATSVTNSTDTTAPTVTINQAGGQSDPTNSGTINYTVVFSEVVTGFTGADVNVTGTAGLGAITKTVTGSGTTYNVAVSGVTGNGTVVAVVAAGGAQDGVGLVNTVSTSTDNTVTLDTTAPTVTINQAGAQADPTNSGTINYAVVFSEAVTGFTGADVNVTGTADLTGITKTVTGSGTTYNVEVSGVAGNGTVIADVAASGAQDAAANSSAASTSTDNSVTLDTAGPTFVNDAAINGDTLVLHFSDALSLDTTNVPLPGAFTVDVGGTGNVVTNVVVSADGTVTLTLTTAVVAGDVVQVAYTDPTGGNDANAIQDIAGNDAATVALTGVTNNTP